MNARVKTQIKKSIIIQPENEPTYIYVLALDPIKNKLVAIDCEKSGNLITGYVYDAKFKRYYVECRSYLDLGEIPISFSVKIARISRWEVKIPVPESLIFEYLSEKQTQMLRDFQNKNKGCSFDYMQLMR